MSFDISDGILIDYKGEEAEVIIPDGVTKIGINAFAKNTTMLSNATMQSIIIAALKRVEPTLYVWDFLGVYAVAFPLLVGKEDAPKFPAVYKVMPSSRARSCKGL